MRARTAMLAAALLFAATAWAADVLLVEDWSKLAVGVKGVPDGWKGDQIWGNPKHDFTIVENDGRRVIQLKSRNDSSTITKELTDKWRLKDTPILEWSWRVVTLPKGADSRNKHTDDQAAQLYVVWPRFPKELRSPRRTRASGGTATSASTRTRPRRSASSRSGTACVRASTTSSGPSS